MHPTLLLQHPFKKILGFLRAIGKGSLVIFGPVGSRYCGWKNANKSAHGGLMISSSVLQGHRGKCKSKASSSWKFLNGSFPDRQVYKQMPADLGEENCVLTSHMHLRSWSKRQAKHPPSDRRMAQTCSTHGIFTYHVAVSHLQLAWGQPLVTRPTHLSTWTANGNCSTQCCLQKQLRAYRNGKRMQFNCRSRCRP